jgi:hypothetical protein
VLKLRQNIYIMLHNFIMLSSFEDHLTQKALVKEKYVPFYMKWVSDCYAFLNIPDSMILNLEQKMQFLKNLVKTHEDWQVKQASNALRLYNFTSLLRYKKIPPPNLQGTKMNGAALKHGLAKPSGSDIAHIARKRPISPGCIHFRDISMIKTHPNW